MFEGNTIFLHDYRRPLRQRIRKQVGPYRFTVPPVARTRKEIPQSIGFYMGAREMDTHGSPIRLRVTEANKHLRDYGYGSLARIDGYYIDEFCEDTLTPIVAILPHSRGYLAGWTMGAGMYAKLDTGTVYESPEDAARAAHDVASYDAEQERDYHAEHAHDDDDDAEDNNA